jgi:hypothetical protein
MLNSILVLALASTLGAVKPADGILWQTEYMAAHAQAKAAGKPLAVFVGKGEQGWNTLVREGKLPADAKKAMTSAYVCLYVNLDTVEGQSVATAFELSGKGLVISDSKGTAQAFSHAGDLTETELTKTITKFADNKISVTKTEDLGRPGEGYIAKPTYVISGCANGRCPQQVGTPVIVGQSYPTATTGNCPNGRCPNQR